MFGLALTLGCAALTMADMLEQSFEFQPAVRPFDLRHLHQENARDRGVT